MKLKLKLDLSREIVRKSDGRKCHYVGVASDGRHVIEFDGYLYRNTNAEVNRHFTNAPERKEWWVLLRVVNVDSKSKILGWWCDSHEEAEGRRHSDHGGVAGERGV